MSLVGEFTVFGSLADAIEHAKALATKAQADVEITREGTSYLVAYSEPKKIIPGGEHVATVLPSGEVL